MKKMITCCLSILLGVMLLSGCGGSAPKEAPKEPSKANVSSVPADIKAIKDRGVLRVGVKLDVPKIGYKDPKTGKVDGFEIDVVRAIAKKLNIDENKIEMQNVTGKTRGALIDNGDIDFAVCTATITEERKKSYSFSDSYFTDGVGFLVKKASGIKGFKDLNGKKIAVAQGTTTRKAIQEEADKQGIKVSFLEFNGFPEMKAALDSGRVDCFSVDKSVLPGYMDDSTVILQDSFSPQPYGVMSSKSKPDLAKLINDTINEMKKSGELDKLVKKWGFN